MQKNSKDFQILIPGICENINLHVKRDFANVIKNLEMAIYPGLPSWDQCSPKGTHKQKRDTGESERDV